MKPKSTIKSITFRYLIIAISACYIASPLKDSVFEMLHMMSHFAEDLIQPNHDISTFKVHDAFEDRLTPNNMPPLANHSHTATGKVIPNHSHNILAVFDLIISKSEEQDEHQKSIFKTKIDKHLITSEYNLKTEDFNTDSKQTWYTFLSYYNHNLPTLSPPPQYIS